MPYFKPLSTIVIVIRDGDTCLEELNELKLSYLHVNLMILILLILLVCDV